MNKKLVGEVSIEERDKIKNIYMRRSALMDLSKILTADNSELYEKLVLDLGETNVKFQEWWSSKAKEHDWEGAENGRWQIDFNTCEIFLVEQ